MKTNLFETNNDIKILHRRINTNTNLHEKGARSLKKNELADIPKEKNPFEWIRDELKEDNIKIDKDFGADVEKTAKEAKSNSSFAKILTEIAKQYKEPFANLPESLKSELDFCKSKIDKAETIDDLDEVLSRIKNIMSTTEILSFKKRNEILEKLLKEKDFSEEVKKLGNEQTCFDTEQLAFQSTNCYNQIKDYINDIFDKLSSVNVKDVKIDSKDVEEAKQSILDKLKSKLNETAEVKKEIKPLEDLINEIDPESNKKGTVEKDVKQNDVLLSGQPKLLQEQIKKNWNTLNDVDKTVLKYYANDQAYSSFVSNDHMIVKGVSSKMTSAGLVCLCGMAMDFYLPEEEDTGDDNDITLVLQTFSYKGGDSSARIHYGQPDDKKKDSQFMEMVVDPAVKMKNEKGRVELVIRTFDDKDETRLITKRGKRLSVYETLKTLFSDGESRRNRRW